MARIRNFIPGDIDARPPRSDVDAYFKATYDDDGTLLMYVYNYSKDGPRPRATPTQSLHFDLSAAKKLKEILEDAFGPL